MRGELEAGGKRIPEKKESEGEKYHEGVCRSTFGSVLQGFSERKGTPQW